jgi:hypothetical protein
VHHIAHFEVLLEDHHGIRTIIHEADAAIDPMAEFIEQVAQAARKTPLDVG